MSHTIIDIGVILLGQLVAAVAVIVSTRVDVKWLRSWTREHARDDAANFADLRARLSNLGG